MPQLRTGGGTTERHSTPFVRVPVATRDAQSTGWGLVAHSEAMRDLLALVEAVSASDCAVLISGETGTGKELVARAVHARSPRAHRRLVAIHCAAIPATLLERELFGHERGAFTGADSRKKGAFEAANGSTFLLDEIGELEPALQVKLLRVLQEKEIARLGSPDTIPVDVRILAATNRELRAETQKATFRPDLYFRLNTVELHVPPLRERSDDILAIAQQVLDRLAAKGEPLRSLSAAAASRLLAHCWPGNVRELISAIERACLLCDGPSIELDHLPADIVDPHGQAPGPARLAPARPAPAPQPLPPLPDFRQARRDFERQYFLRALASTEGNISAAARHAGLSWKHFRHKMHEHHIRPDAWAALAPPP